MNISDIIMVLFFVVLITGSIFYWGFVMPARGCSVLDVFSLRECWCIGNHSESSDFGALNYFKPNQSISYGGFRCGSCEEFCNGLSKN